MPSKEEIFDNISNYSAFQIVQFIQSGVVSVLELEDPENTGGEYSSDLRDKVNELLCDHEPQDWEKALATDTVEAYQYYLDTYPDGLHREEARTRKKALLNRKADTPTPAPAKKDDWAHVDKESLPALQAYVEANPNSPHKAEAQRLIMKIRNRIEAESFVGLDMEVLIKKAKNIKADKKVLNADEQIIKLIEENIDKPNDITSEALVKALAEDHNLFSAYVINKLFNDGYLSMQDFRDMGIDRDFVRLMLENTPVQSFKRSGTLTQISRHSTEIYFWGIPSSGKSCALGGILSVADNGKVASHLERDSNCQGYGYMARLMQQFPVNGDVGTLPEGTAITDTYEMGFNLTDLQGLVHPITCIDLAGEMIRCMYKFDSNEELNENELKTLDTLHKILVDNRSGNRKMHFFVIEYGADDRLYEGLPQKTYLEAAVAYIKRNEIFNRDTDAIYILLSKVDKAPKGQPLNTVLGEYLDRNYKGFTNQLKSICRDYEINGGEVEVLPFSLGTVCFQNYCRFDETAAEMVVKKIIERVPGYKQDKLNKLLGKFKG